MISGQSLSVTQAAPGVVVCPPTHGTELCAANRIALREVTETVAGADPNRGAVVVVYASLSLRTATDAGPAIHIRDAIFAEVGPTRARPRARDQRGRERTLQT